VEGDELWNEWEEKLRLEGDEGDVRHDLVNDHELEVERVKVGELEEKRFIHEEDGELEGKGTHEDHGELEGRGMHEDVELGERTRYDEEVEDWDVIGITEEVLAFTQNIARHPETWFDFPLLPDDEESDGPFSCNFCSLCSNLLLLNETTCKVSSLSLGQT
jgi:hypothetical protein